MGCPGVPLIFLTRGFGAKFHRPDTISDSRHTQGFIFPAVAKTPEGRGLIKEQYFEARHNRPRTINLLCEPVCNSLFSCLMKLYVNKNITVLL